MAKKVYVGVDNVARKVKKIYFGVDGSYDEVEYIKSTGSQSIITDIIPTSTTKIVVDCELSYVSDAYTKVLGTYELNSYFSWWTNGTKLEAYYGNSYQAMEGPVGRTILTADGNVWSTSNNSVSFDATTVTVTDPIYLFSIEGGGNYSGSSMTLYSCQIYDNGVLIRDYVPCIDSNGLGGLFDRVGNKFYANAGTDSFIVGATTGSSFNTGTARKVRKGYIGVGGVARLFWSGGELAYYGTATNLSVARQHIASTTVGNRALFAGGSSGNNHLSNALTTVDAYDKTLTRTVPTELSTARTGLAATTIGNFALFGGGCNGTSTSKTYNIVEAYDQNLTRTIITPLPSKRFELEAATIGNHALFAGGSYNGNTQKDVWAYNDELTLTTLDSMSENHSELASATVGNYALFAGGENEVKGSADCSDVVDAYDISLTRTVATSLNGARYSLSGTSNGKYAIFAGGLRNAYVSPNFDAYDETLTLSQLTKMSEGRYRMTSTRLEEYAIFTGGLKSTTAEFTDTYAYDQALTLTMPTGLSQCRTEATGATIGDFALFAGGNTSNGSTVATNSKRLNSVEVYAIL